MSKKLFVTAPISKASNNAIVGGPHASRYTYIYGYYEGARILANSAMKTGPKDLLFYPVCFNYRHYLELHLKSLILNVEQLYFVMDELDETKGKLDSSAQSRLASTHNIGHLFALFEKRLDLVSDEIFNPSVKQTIIDLDKADSDGQVYRYHERTNSTPSLPDIGHYDLGNIVDKMKGVHDLLVGVDLWIDHHYGIAMAMRNDLNPDYF